MTQATIIDGKAAAAAIVEKLAVKSQNIRETTGMPPGLAVVLVGDDPASAVYVRAKGKMAEKCGFHSVQHNLPASTSQAELEGLIQTLNDDPAIHGILVQLPLPRHIDASAIICLIKPEKDVDGFHPVNVGLLASGQLDQALIPCTPAGCIILAKQAMGGDLKGKHAVIVGRSNIVGKPAALLLLHENCTVTITHSHTQDLPAEIARADLLIAAVGIPEMVDGAWIKPGATVIDVGINRVPAPEKGDDATKLVGDVAFASAVGRAGAITPVPGGVGPMTIAQLMQNTLTAAERAHHQ